MIMIIIIIVVVVIIIIIVVIIVIVDNDDNSNINKVTTMKNGRIGEKDGRVSRRVRTEGSIAASAAERSPLLLAYKRRWAKQLDAKVARGQKQVLPDS
jgi:hypothetical protein